MVATHVGKPPPSEDTGPQDPFTQPKPHQGIVKDMRGQEQPRDKRRAQQASGEQVTDGETDDRK
jgi:hypothetical protein